MVKFYKSLSLSYKLMFVMSLSFLANSVIVLKIEIFPSFPAYVIGFSVGLGFGLVAMALMFRGPHPVLTEAQVNDALKVVKRLSLIPTPVASKVPFELARLVYDAKDVFPENAYAHAQGPQVLLDPAKAPATNRAFLEGHREISSGTA